MFIDQRIKENYKLVLFAFVMFCAIFIPLPIIRVFVFSVVVWVVFIIAVVFLKFDKNFPARFGSISYLVIFYSLLISYYVITNRR